MGNTQDSLAIGIDVGATKIAAALITSRGQVLATQQVKTRTDLGVNSVLDQIAELTRELSSRPIDDPILSTLPILGIGIGIPGHVDTKAGIVRDAINLGWREVHLAAGIEARLDSKLPVWVEKDSNASTLGEFHFGAARGYRDIVYLCIGSGLGGGIIVNGSLVAGSSWQATDLGHLSIDVDGLPCVCGLRGCVETIVSGPGLLNWVSESLAQGNNSSRLSREIELTTEAVVSAARDGDELALAAFLNMGRNLGIVISFCLSVLDPALIVIGGGLGLAAFDLIIPAARHEIERRVLPSIHTNLKITPSLLASSAVGAASLALSQTYGND
ncbi:ROK family protein [Chloroflexota bacterium]